MEMESLLVSNLTDNDFEGFEKDPRPQKHSDRMVDRVLRIYIFLFHAIAVFLLLYLGLSCIQGKAQQAPHTKLWKPLSVSNIISEEHSVDHDIATPFSGHPTSENTKAWEDLIQPTFFGATEDELRGGQESLHDSVQLADQPGYLAALGVYHELHCLRQLRLYLYRDTYFANLTEDNIQWFYDHLDHCIETLRISIMCNADLSLYTFYWKTREENRPHAKSNSKRECVNWNEVEQWSTKRKISLWPRLIRKGGEKDAIHL